MSDKRNIRRKHRSRQPRRKSRAFDATCRNHGSCPWCANGRRHKFKRQAVEAAS